MRYFDRRARETKREAAIDVRSRFRTCSRNVFKIMCLIENNDLETMGFDARHVQAHTVVGRQYDLGVLDR